MKEDSKDLGAKFDVGKPQIARGVLGYFPDAIGMVAKCSEFGAEKYEWGSWHDVPDGKIRFLNAVSRHLVASAIDINSVDKESSLLHLAHVAWNALAVLQFVIEGQEHHEEVEDKRSPIEFSDDDYKSFVSYIKKYKPVH